MTSADSQVEESQKKVHSIESMETKMMSHSEQLKKALIEQTEQHIKELREHCEHDLKRIDEKHAITMDDCKAKKVCSYRKNEQAHNEKAICFKVSELQWENPKDNHDSKGYFRV